MQHPPGTLSVGLRTQHGKGKRSLIISVPLRQVSPHGSNLDNTPSWLLSMCTQLF